VLAKSAMMLSSFTDRIKLVHIIVPGIIMGTIEILVNQFAAAGTNLSIFNAAFELLLSVIVSTLLLIFYRAANKQQFVFSRTLRWLLLTSLSWSVGDTIYLYLSSVKIDPFISPVDFFYISATLLLIVTALTLAGSQPPSRRRNMVFIEITILVLSAAIIFAILLLFRGNPNLKYDAFTLFMVFIYPVLDILGIWIIMILFFTHTVKSSQKVLGIFFAGAICIFLSDLFYLVSSIYVSVGRDYIADLGYYAFYTLLLLGGFTGFKEIREKASGSSNEQKAIFKQNNWIVFLPGVFLITLIGLLLVFALNQSFVLFHGIVILIVIVIVLFIIHQYLVITDNIKLTKEMRRINTQLESIVEQRTAELSKANIELQDEMKERQNAEEHLARSNKDLALLNKDKDKLFSMLAHDLRSPLGSMMNLSALLVENVKDFDESELMEVIDTLNKSATQTFQLLNDLLAWSTIQMGRGEREKEIFSISEIVNENIINLNSDATRKQIEILADIDPAIVAYADKFAIQTVIRNLLGNAIKFTPNHGSINVFANKKNNTVEISVADNGLGISIEKQRKIFRVDTISSSPGTDGEKGTGFGLLLCKDLVERNGGKIWFESEKGKGSTFYFSLLVHEEDSLNLASDEKLQTMSETRIEYKSDESRRLAFTTLYGNFNSIILADELSRLWKSAQFNPNYSVFIDIRKASFSGDSKEFPDFLGIFSNMPGTHTNRKFAVLTETPQQVAYSTMFGQYMKSNFPLVVEVFSTYDAAMTWLGV
jgi:signal transduction histidine kinase